VKSYWAIIADNLSKAGWSWGCVAAVDSEARTCGFNTPNGNFSYRQSGSESFHRPLVARKYSSFSTRLRPVGRRDAKRELCCLNGEIIFAPKWSGSQYVKD